jgi:hypothetical protein
VTATAAHRMTFQEWSRIVSDPTRDNAYQRVTRLGGSVGRYLAWKRPEAAERSLEIYEFYLAALCVHLAQNHGDPDVREVTAEMLLDAAQQNPIGSYGLTCRRMSRTVYAGPGRPEATQTTKEPSSVSSSQRLLPQPSYPPTPRKQHQRPC